MKTEHTAEPIKRFDLEFADPYGFREGMILVESGESGGAAKLVKQNH